MNVGDDADVAVSTIAAAIGEPARARILYCLVDGHARTSTIPERQAAYIRVTNAFELDRVLAALNTVIEWAKSQDVFSKEFFSE
jgi:hypothetical protein